MPQAEISTKRSPLSEPLKTYWRKTTRPQPLRLPIVSASSKGGCRLLMFMASAPCVNGVKFRGSSEETSIDCDRSPVSVRGFSRFFAGDNHDMGAHAENAWLRF